MERKAWAVLRCVGAAVVLFGVVAFAGAEPVSWSFSATVRGPLAWPDGSSFRAETTLDAFQINPPPGEDPTPASLTLRGLSGGQVGSAAVSLASLFTYEDWQGEAPQFSAPFNDYGVRLVLTDDASGASGELIFTGEVTGGFRGSAPDEIANAFTGPTAQSLTLGGNLYTVTIGPFVVPPISNGPGQPVAEPGSLGASVEVGPASPNETPEPGTLLLAGLGLPLLGGLLYRRRQPQPT